MGRKLLSSNTLRVMVIVYAMIAASFVMAVDGHVVAAQSATTPPLVIGLQNDAPNLNYFDPATNSVWKAYIIGYDFESLFTYDPDQNIYAVLADPSFGGTNCPSGLTAYPGVLGACIDSTGYNVTIRLRTGITFTDGKALTRWDVIFSYQTLWTSTYNQYIYEALFWNTPRVPLWNATSAGLAYSYNPATGVCTGVGCSHLGVENGTYANSIVFHLTKQEVQVGSQTITGAYALFFTNTLGIPIIPEHIWTTHINPDAQLNPLEPSIGGNPNYVTDTYDRSIDFKFGSSPNDVAATVGTGPFKLIDWIPGTSSEIQVSSTYWGFSQYHTWRNTNYYFGPLYVRQINFLIFGSLDVVSLALQQGSIDTMVWSLTPGFLSQVQFNPAISVEQVTDDGFYYLAFNMRVYPFSDLCLREAISMAVDKQYIVNTLRGGFATPGTVPISVINPVYENFSATPPSFNLAGAATLLDSCGYHVNPSTGFRTLPNGQPFSATILTPPKDYDPTRADAGIMISNNLKSIGLDINSAPTSFDTIVAKAFSPPVQFQMFILGWVNLGPFPEAYLCSFFCHNDDVNINPSGSNAPGFNNATFDNLMSQALITVDPSTRQTLIQNAEGILTDQLPYDTLYYNKDLNAYRNDRWVGWVNTPPNLYNFYSLVNLRPAGIPAPPPPPSGALQLAMTLPARALGDHTVPVNVFVSRNGVPVNGAAVYLNGTLESGVKLGSDSATTNAEGMATVSWHVPVIQGSMILTGTAVLGGSVGVSAKQVEVTIGPPAPMAILTLSTTTPVVAPGGTATVTANLVDGQGNGLSNVRVSIDTTLMQGTIAPPSQLTGSGGTATFTYTAPATAQKFPNADLMDTIRANVTVPDTIAGATQTYSLVIMVQNPNAPNWVILSTPGLGTGLVLNATNPQTTIQVLASGFAGTPIAGVAIAPNYTDKKNVTISWTSGANVTDASGLATFTVAETAYALAHLNNTNVLVRFTAPFAASATSDELSFLVSDGVTTGYAAEITFGTPGIAYAAAKGTDTVTAKVWAQTGLPAVGVPVMFNIPLGDLGLPAQFPFTYSFVNVEGTKGGYQNAEYGGSGLDMGFGFAFGSLGGTFQNSTGPLGPSNPPITPWQGPAYGVENAINDYEYINVGNNYATNTTIDSCDPTTYPAGFNGLYYVNATSVTGAAGTYTTSFFVNPEVSDQLIPVTLYVGHPGLNVTINACSFVASIGNAAFAIDAGVVSQRAPVFALGSVAMSPAVMTSDSPTMQVTAKLYTLSGPAANVQVFLTASLLGTVRNVLGLTGGTMTTDSTGTLTYTVNLQTGAVFSYLKKALPGVSQSFAFSIIPADPAYAFGGRDQMLAPAYGTDSWWSSPTSESLLAKIPFGFDAGYLYIPTTVGFASATVGQTLVSPGSTIQVTVAVDNGVGEPIANASVWSASVSALTALDGTATFNVTVGSGSVENLAVVTTPDGQVIRTWYGVMASGPVLSYGAITPTVNTAGSASTFSLLVTNTLPVAGTATVWLQVGSANVSAATVTLASSGSQTVQFSYVFATAGTYTVTVGTQSIQVTVPAASGPDLTGLYALAGGLLVVGLVVGAVVGLMLSRRRKPPTAMPEETASEIPPEESKAAEEELGPEEKL